MNFYLILKSLHLIAVISWMAGLLYLPRIFVYHSQNNAQPIISEVFKVMEKKLFYYICYGFPSHVLFSSAKGTWTPGGGCLRQCSNKARIKQQLFNLFYDWEEA